MTSETKLSIPLISLAPLLSTSAPTRLQAGQKILSAFEDYGFLYLSNHPIPPSTISHVFSSSTKFFSRPHSQKQSLAWTNPRANRGYVSHGREKVSHSLTASEVSKERESNPDMKESMEIGRENEEGLPNQWPDNIDEEGKEFTKTMKKFFLECKDIHKIIMSSIALGLGLRETYFDEFVRTGDNTLRLLHYPPTSRELFREGAIRASPHTDYGSITLLFQDDRGGLQVQKEGNGTSATSRASPTSATGEANEANGTDGNWEDVTPIPDTIVVNAGDLLTRWSNGRIKSTKHRVVEPPVKTESEQYPARYSIAYFCNPDFDKEIEALPGTFGEGREKKWDAINSGDYLVQRLTATY